LTWRKFLLDNGKIHGFAVGSDFFERFRSACVLKDGGALVEKKNLEQI